MIPLGPNPSNKELSDYIGHTMLGKPFSVGCANWLYYMQQRVDAIERHYGISINGHVVSRDGWVSFRVTGIGRPHASWARIDWRFA